MPSIHQLVSEATSPVIMLPGKRRRLIRLTPVIRKVLELLCYGYSNGDIGRELGIKERTVKNYVTKLLDLFNETNRVDLVLKARKEKGLTVKNRLKACFTPREKTLAPLLATGLSYADIEKRLGVNKLSLKNYAVSMYNKTGTWNRLEFAIWYQDTEFAKQEGK